MFIIGFFMTSIIRRVLGLLLGFVLVAVALVVVFGVLAVTGGPSACTPGGGPITINAANSANFQQKWDALTASLSGGAPGTATFNESELSSRADTYLKQHDVGLHDPRICIHGGSGEASASFSFLAFDVKVGMRGTVDLSGRHPKAKIDHLAIGNIPGLLTGPAETVVTRAIDSALSGVNLDHRYSSTLSQEQAAVTGAP